jgi:hypothetical protein
MDKVAFQLKVMLLSTFDCLVFGWDHRTGVFPEFVADLRSVGGLFFELSGS